VIIHQAAVISATITHLSAFAAASDAAFNTSFVSAL